MTVSLALTAPETVAIVTRPEAVSGAAGRSTV
jgi:hypothetical protein